MIWLFIAQYVDSDANIFAPSLHLLSEAVTQESKRKVSLNTRKVFFQAVK